MNDVMIRKASEDLFDTCCDLLADSTLGKKYYPARFMLESALADGMKEDSVYVGEIGGQVFGFIWFAKKGSFAFYPYLHIIVIGSEWQGRGLGGRMMDFFEAKSLEMCGGLKGKSFLVVAEDNQYAHEFYLERGYRDITVLKGLFRKGINEILMIRTLRKQHEAAV